MKILGNEASYSKESSPILSIGSSLTIGSYAYGSHLERRPIEWIVVDKQDELIILVTKMIIDSQLYDLQAGLVNYASSNLAVNWGNNFFNRAFNEAERAAIKTVSSGGHRGKIHLPTADEVKRWWPEPRQRVAMVTPYAQARGAYDFEGLGWYWLADLAKDAYHAGGVFIDGAIDQNYYVACPYGGVRPVIRLDKTL